MTKEEINQLILLIFSEDEEDFKLALNMIMKMECSGIELDVFVGHCNNLLIANLKCSARVKVLISSLGSVLLDKGYEVISACNNIERWNSAHEAIMNQMYKNDWKIGTGLTQGYPYAGTTTPNNPFPPSSSGTVTDLNSIFSAPFNAGTTLTNNGFGGLIQALKNTNSPFLPSYKQGITLADGTGTQSSPPF